MAFDLKTQRLNKKGQIVAKQPYTLYIDKGVQKFERPPGSGNFFNADGSPFQSEKKSTKSHAHPHAHKGATHKHEEKHETKADADMDDLKHDLMQDEK